jgi:hypothetical protein
VTPVTVPANPESMLPRQSQALYGGAPKAFAAHQRPSWNSQGKSCDFSGENVASEL